MDKLRSTRPVRSLCRYTIRYEQNAWQDKEIESYQIDSAVEGVLRVSVVLNGKLNNRKRLVLSVHDRRLQSCQTVANLYRSPETVTTSELGFEHTGADPHTVNQIREPKLKKLDMKCLMNFQFHGLGDRQLQFSQV